MGGSLVKGSYVTDCVLQVASTPSVLDGISKDTEERKDSMVLEEQQTLCMTGVQCDQ